jgi:competence protein ComEC
MKVLDFPLIKITGCFVLGLIFAHYTKPPFLFILSTLLVGLFVLLFMFFSSKKRMSLNPFFGITALVLSFFIGAFTFVSNNQTLNTQHYVHHLSSANKECKAEISIREKLKNTKANDRYVADVITINNQKSFGKIILNIRKATVLPTIDIGSHLKVKGSFYKNRAPNNPNQFDYGNYLENQQIYAQLYADASDIKIGIVADKTISYYASKLRNKIIHNLEKHHFNKKELSVVVALILGQQQDISPDVVRDYQYAGAVHVLSVSGLHVGFILLFVTFLLKPFPNTKRASLLKLLIVILSLWGFGILAGLAPSIVRSVTMFSFVAVGMFLQRSINIYNTLAVSILVILLFQPSFLFDVGFQLSYVALYFIVWLQPLLSSIWRPKNKIINYLWDIITVSFAAQIGTFPMSIYYFHQFPGLFFVTNLVILPGMSIILGLGVVVMVLAAFDVVWMPLLKSLEWSIWLLNKIIAWVASFEDFIFRDIPLNFYIMWSCYLMIFSLIIWFKKPTYQKLVIGLAAIILVQLTAFQSKYVSQKESELIVFHKKGTTLITERHGNKIKLYSNDSLLKNTDKNLVLKSYVVANFCKITAQKQVSKTLFFNNKKILILDEVATYTKEQPDVLIIVNSPRINLERLFKIWKPQQVVVDGSNFKTYSKAWKATCAKQNIPFHDTAEMGFYRL